jgi:Fic family protein
MSTWKEIEKLTCEFETLNLHNQVDYDKYYIYSIIAHSTAIEGSTLTEAETQMLFDEGIVAAGKPFFHHLMNQDLKCAYEYAETLAKQVPELSPDLLRELSSMVMKSTGGINNVMAGSFDSSKGEFRLCGVQAGVGGRSYMDYRKVPDKVTDLCKKANERFKTASTLEEKYNLSFDLHYNLATIHPWVDGNGRTSRLAMNYAQLCMKLLPAKIFLEDRAEYIDSLKLSQEFEDATPFRQFMANQLSKTLEMEIESFKKSQNKDFEVSF